MINISTLLHTIEKKILTTNHDILLGLEFQQKKAALNEYSAQGASLSPRTGPDTLDTYMVYLEDLYKLNDNNLLTFSAKLDYYEDSFSKSSTEYSLRLGYITNFATNWKNKLFITKKYMYPSMLQTSFTPPLHIPNPDLESNDIEMITGELQYAKDSTILSFGYAYKTIENPIVFNKMRKMFVNGKNTVYFRRLYTRGEYKFDVNNKIILEYYASYCGNHGSPTSGAIVQLFNKIGKINIYNELVYRADYTLNYGAGDVKIDKGYDYTLALSYPLSKKLNLKLKGENLFNKASKSLIDPQGNIKASAIQRRGILTMEYTF